ncbi:MAG: YcxB family protein [Cytophagaceae bacterium]
MIVKTRKYQLPKNTYVKLGLESILKKQWWFIGAPILLGSIAFVLPNYKWWFISLAITAVILYFLFWLIQFYGVTQLEQNKILFEKLSYEIDSRQVLIKVNTREGMQVQWSSIQDAYKRKEDFVLVISKAQFIHLPFKIFNSENDVKFVETILKRKEYIK